MNVPHSELIDKLGVSFLRDRYGLKRQNIYSWRQEGIPHKYRVSVAKEAAEKGVIVPPDFFAGMVA